MKVYLGMGMDLRKKSSSDKTTALQCDAEGKLRHDAIARIGHSKDKVGPNFLRLTHVFFPRKAKND